MTVATTVVDERVAGGAAPPAGGRVGDSPVRPDGAAKVRGEFEFASDMGVENMLWGCTLRSPQPHASIRSVDIGPALAMPGVVAVLTADDLVGSPAYGLISADQPVLAAEVVRYVGEAVALVAADHPDTARRAAAAIGVGYGPLPRLTDPAAALDPATPAIHPDGNVIRRMAIEHGDPAATGTVVVEGTYEVGTQDQAFLGPESGLAVPDGEGGVDLWVATQWLHHDRDQVASCLGLASEDVRLHLGGVGGAFGAREDLSLQVHACLLALRTGRPVKMSYPRDESFVGHVHRHPARMRYRHHADGDGVLVKVEAEILLDGGAYASSSWAVVSNAARFAAGPYRVPNVVVDAAVVRTNNPPCGAMRGFGAVQVCFAHEAQMDKLAARLRIDPVELRLRNAMATGDVLPTGQAITGTAPVRECIEAAAALPLPAPARPDTDEWLALPGGVGRTADPGRVRRGVGFAVGYKNLLYSEGFDDDSEAQVRLEDGVATVTCAVAEVGQGFVTLAGQIVRTVLGGATAALAPADTTSVGSAGSTSASRQTWMSGGAVLLACQDVAAQVLAAHAKRLGEPAESLSLTDDGRIVGLVRPGYGNGDKVDIAVAEAAGDAAFEATAVHRHKATVPLDDRGQGDADVSFVFAAHRAVVDVDVDLGLVRVVQITTGQDVGRVLHPTQLMGQIEGGIAQGLGLAVMEELVVDDGVIRNPSFTDYLLPTIADMPDVLATCIEQPEPGAPLGAKGVGEPPTISSTAAIAAAIRAATGVDVARVPVRPWDLI